MEIGDVPTPAPGPGGVQIRVTAAALNHIDLWLRNGLPALPVSLPHVSGGDVCGVVSELGPGVAPRAGCAVGDRVLINPGISCGRCAACLSGRDNFCPDYRMIGEQTWGGLAEYLVVPAQNLVPAPRERVPLDDAQLAALPTTFMTVWQMLVERAQIRLGETVLVLAAGSGVGTAAIQIARYLEAGPVIATTRTPAKAAALRALGAHEVIDARDPGWVAAALRATGGRGVDVIIDHVGGPMLPGNVEALALEGRIVSVGRNAGRVGDCDLDEIARKRARIIGVTFRTRTPEESLACSERFAAHLLEAVAKGALKPVLDRTFPFERLPDAHRYMLSDAQTGKIVLVVDERGR